MLPAQLTPASFDRYPPRARALALAHLALFQQLPLAFLPSLLRELIDFDTRFPSECASLEGQLLYLGSLPPDRLARTFAPFEAIRLTPAQQKLPWVDAPLNFSEAFSAYLWSSGQMPAFHEAATSLGQLLAQAIHPTPPPIPRLGIAIIGRGASTSSTPLFRKLRPLGTLFTHVDPSNGLQQLLSAVAQRASDHPAPYAHWYIDGASAQPPAPTLTTVSYDALAPVREALLARIQHEVAQPGMGPEQLRDTIAHLSPAALGLGTDPILDHFQVQLLTEGSGTQIFSTTFVQWATREVLRRASATTLLVRYAPRQRQRPMSELLSTTSTPVQLDPAGSLIDADMAAWYHYLNQQRLPGAPASTFLAWFEDQPLALAIGPTLPRNTQSSSPLTLSALLRLAQS